MQLLAQAQPGALYDAAMKAIARVMGLREGADGMTLRPKVVGYLTAVVFGHHPMASLRPGTVRELQTLATSLDLLEAGSLAELADVLMQRFKALELSLSDGSWQVAQELELVGEARPALASIDEQDAARRSAMLRSRLQAIRGRGRGSG